MSGSRPAYSTGEHRHLGGSGYEVRRRQWPKRRKPRLAFWRKARGFEKELARPWALLRDGVPIGFYETKAEAWAAAPGGRDAG